MLAKSKREVRGTRRSAYPGEHQAITPALCEWFRFLGAQDGRRKWGRGGYGAAIRLMRNRPDLTVIEQCHRREALGHTDIDSAGCANSTGTIATFARHLLARRRLFHSCAVRSHVHVGHRHFRHGIVAAPRNGPGRSHAAEKNPQRKCEGRDLLSKKVRKHDGNLIGRCPVDQGWACQVNNS